jgi:uncharacterized protein
MKQSGSADLILMGGSIPPWLLERMTRLCLPVVEAIVADYGQQAFLQRLSDPFWFQSFGAVIGMDWNSSGVTTAVMAALKKSLNPHARQLGLYVCGGKGKDSLLTPDQLVAVGDRTGLDGLALARSSRLAAKVDNTAVQDGFQIYMHYFVVSDRGDWSVIQQGMQGQTSQARRYHWHSASLKSFVEEPHTAICGDFQGEILNLVDKQAQPTQQGILSLTQEQPDRLLREIRHLVMPSYKNIKAQDVDLKRLGSILWLAQEQSTRQFEELLLLKGLGPRTLQSLALVSEVIHGTPARFTDPARFAFAHGGKGGRPFPVPTKVYDETIEVLKLSVEKARIGEPYRLEALKKLTSLAQRAESDFVPTEPLEKVIQKERRDAWKYGGRSIHGFAKPPGGGQLNLFDS